MPDELRWYAGIDWASESHHVFLTDNTGHKVGEKVFRHGGEGLAEMPRDHFGTTADDDLMDVAPDQNIAIG